MNRIDGRTEGGGPGRRTRRAAALLVCCACSAETEFTVLATLDVGLNPHQIAFTDDGRTAYVAAAGSDQVVEIDATALTVTKHFPVPDSPLGVAVLPREGGLAVARFGADEIVRISFSGAEPSEGLETGGAPSLLVGPISGNRYLVSVEQVDRMWVLNLDDFSLERSYPTGDRPFPPAATSDGGTAFVPNYDDGTVTVIDLVGQGAEAGAGGVGQILGTVAVGEHPSGGVVLPGDSVYAVAIRAENKVLFINIAALRVVDSLTDGIGESPFSVVVTPDGRLAFVNNTASHDISVIALPEREVVARIPIGEQPIVMAVHPSGGTLWVSSEGSHELAVIEIPERWRT
ncbi:MAG: YncE family protein [Gemmatimonadetes bacterium]|nr:YncE family protein [Gemmatimonadota bacterium]